MAQTSLSISRAELDGTHSAVVNGVSDRVYYVIGGQARITVDDNEYTASAGDTVVIHRGQAHGISGSAEYLVITSPPFDRANEHPA